MKTSAAVISLATFATAHPHPGYPEFEMEGFEMTTAMPYVPITETTVLRFSSKYVYIFFLFGTDILSKSRLVVVDEKIVLYHQS